MTTPLNTQIRMLFLAGYAASLSLGSVQVLPQTSLPFIFAVAFLGYKLYDMQTNHRGIIINPEGIGVLVLYLYLIGAEQFLHKGNIFITYYISFGMNLLMMLLLADEFYRDSGVRDKVMFVYVTSIVVVTSVMTLGILTTASQTGRLSFLGQNQNEMAAAFLIAYCWLSKEFVFNDRKRIGKLLLLLISAIIVLNALIGTGTRFALGGVIAVLLLLLLSTLLDRSKVVNILPFVSANSVFIAFKVMKFAPMQERLSPAVNGNNLSDLGGRTPLWQQALNAFKESPLTGLGHDGYKKFILMRENFFELPHNFPIEIAAIAGVVGITLLTIAGLILCWKIFMHKDHMSSLIVLIWCIPVLIIMLMLNVTHLKIFWFILAYLMTFNFASKQLVTTKGML